LKPINIFIFIFIAFFTSVSQANQPNIILILADDLDKELFSHSVRIDALITQQGARFDNHMVSLSLCCPSRATTLRAQYAHNTGIYHNGPGLGGFDLFYAKGLESSTVANWLQGAGYQTALIGKYLNGYPNAQSGPNYIPPGWNYFISPNAGSPYTEYNYSLNENGITTTHGHQSWDYLQDLLTSRAVNYIKNVTVNNPDQPFFMYLAPYLPHAPALPPARYLNVPASVKLPSATDQPQNFIYLNNLNLPTLYKVPRSPAYSEIDVNDKPAWVRKLTPFSDYWRYQNDLQYTNRRLSMQAVEDMVESVVNTLKASGQLNNTYIIFTSDNGYHQGQHRMNAGKDTGYEEDINVPMVMRGPGIPKGTVISNITANVDLATTFADIAGVTPPSFVDGRSFKPLLDGSQPDVWRKALFLEHRAPTITKSSNNGLLEPPDFYDLQMTHVTDFGPPVFVGIRTQANAINGYGPINYIEYDTGEREFYDISVDPLQLNNNYPATDPAVISRLSNWLTTIKSASGQALRTLEETGP